MQRESLNRKNDKSLLLFFFVFLFIALTGNISASSSTSNLVVPLTLFQNNYDGSRTVHLKPKVVDSSMKLSHLASNTVLDLRVIEPLQNEDQLKNLLKSIYDPASPQFHHFLRPGQFAQAYGPSSINTAHVKEFLTRHGFTVSDEIPSGVIKAKATVDAVEKTFGVKMNVYLKSDMKTQFYAPDGDAKIPTEVAENISMISGLDNTIHFEPSTEKITGTIHITSKLSDSPSVGSGIGCGAGYPCWAPADIEKAYNLNSISSTGLGQSGAVFELDGYYPSDIVTYLNQYNLTANASNAGNPCNYTSSTPEIATNFNSPINPSCYPTDILKNILIDGVSGVPGYNDNGEDESAEVTLDIDIMDAIAPGLNNIYVYEAPNTLQGWEDEWTQIATDDRENVISCSWGEPEIDSPFIAFDNQIFEQLAAQGQSVFVASGDEGAYAAGRAAGLAVQEPAAEPFVTAVGATLLNFVNSDGSYDTQATAEIAAQISGGGISEFETIPTYQQGVIGLITPISQTLSSTSMRNVPDVALDGGPLSPYSFYVTSLGGWIGLAGTSIATPEWAALTARVNQGRANAGEDAIGFLNPLLYSIAQNSVAYSNDFHQITLGNNAHYFAYPGYNDATGLGTFNGANMYHDLVFPSPTGLTAMSGASGAPHVSLAWAGNGAVVSYNVYKGTTPGGENPTPITNVSTTSYTDTAVAAGTVYYYKVSAVYNGQAESYKSFEVSAQPGSTHTITVDPLENGTITYLGQNYSFGGAITVNNWSSPVFTITAAANYNINQITIDGTVITTPNPLPQILPYTYTYTFNNVTADHTIQVAFSPVNYTITPSAYDNTGTSLGGTISPSAVTSVASGTSQTFTFTQNTGWWLQEVVVDGTTIVTPQATSNSDVFTYTFNDVLAQHTIEALFATYFTVGASAMPNITACPITPGGSSNYVSGSVVQYSITVPPITGYSLVQLLIDGTPATLIPLTGYPYTYVHYFWPITSNHTVEAICATAPGSPTIVSVTSANASASVSFNPPTSNGGSAITSYTVTSSPGGITSTGASSPIAVSGLNNGTGYTFTVYATNAAGNGPASSPSSSVTPIANIIKAPGAILNPINGIVNGDGTMTIHVKPVMVDSSQKLSSLDPNTVLDISFIEPLSNQDKLTKLLKDLYDPASPSYHHFLTSGQFVQDFGPTGNNVKAFLTTHGFTVPDQIPSGVVEARGSVDLIEKTFGVEINNYLESDKKTSFYAPANDLTVPAEIAGEIVGVIGLDNALQFKNTPKILKNPKMVSKPQTSIKPQSLTNLGSGKGCTADYPCWAPNDIDEAYNLNSISSTGMGQSVALFERDGYNPNDIVTYLNQYNFTSDANNAGNPCNYPSTTPMTKINFNNPVSPNPNSPCSTSNILQNILIDGVNGLPGDPSYGNQYNGTQIPIFIPLMMLLLITRYK